MIKFTGSFSRMVRDRENFVKVTFEVPASELKDVILIPAETELEIEITPK